MPKQPDQNQPELEESVPETRSSDLGDNDGEQEETARHPMSGAVDRNADEEQDDADVDVDVDLEDDEDEDDEEPSA